MQVPIGELRQPVAVLTPSTTVDEAGGEVITYTQGAMFYASLRPLGSREAIQYGQVNASISHLMFCHYTDAAQIDGDSRVINLESEEQFDVVGPPLNDQKRSFAKLTLVRRENE